MKRNQKGQSITEYAVFLALILVVVVGTIRLVGSGTKLELSSVNSAMQ